MASEERSAISASTSADALFSDGYALLGNILPEDLVSSLKQEFDRRYLHLTLPRATFGDSLETGERRYMLTVELSGPFGDCRLFANRFLTEILDIVFARKYVLASFGAVLSLPGAKAQHAHRDGRGLYAPQLDSMLPPYAVTVGIPLVDMNLEQGTTQLFAGSHRWKESSSSVLPDVPAGSALIWDYRTIHGGTENRSDRYRPLLYITYSKPWWQDSDNFEPVWSDSGSPVAQRRLLFGKDFFSSLRAEARYLFGSVDASRKTE